MDKISALKETKEKLTDKIKSFGTLFYSEIQSNKSFLNQDIIYRNSNEESSTIILKINSGEKIKNLIEDEFKRVVCLKGVIKIIIPSYKNDEEFILKSPNTLLIPPKTIYNMEVLEDCEIINIYKPKKEFFEKLIVLD